MKDLKELEKKYLELGKEIEILKEKEKKSKLPKSWIELEEISGYYVNSDSDIHGGYTTDTNFCNRTMFPTKEEAEAAVALAQLCQLRDRYNGDWRPNWRTNDDKYTIFIYADMISIGSVSLVSYVLAFKTPELRNEFLTNFRQLIETAKPLL